jgi:hypothetical protein
MNLLMYSSTELWISAVASKFSVHDAAFPSVSMALGAPSKRLSVFAGARRLWFM